MIVNKETLESVCQKLALLILVVQAEELSEEQKAGAVDMVYESIEVIKRVEI